MAALDTYTGPWTQRQATHLLRRASFGATPAQIASVVDQGMEATITQLFTDLPLPEPPPDPQTGASWVDGGDGYDPTRGPNYYNNVVRAWWTGLMIEQPISIREKLTLFWHNHYATESIVVFNAFYPYRMLSHLREHALGNFKGLTRQVTLEPAMLRYLNGNSNTVGTPNENYARELQELFTIGKGPVAGEGDYTYYTEEDVRAAARVLTGWRENRRTGDAGFFPNLHDSSNKQFSARYQNNEIRGRFGPTAGDEELDDLLDMIYAQDRTAEYIVEKFYRWFVDSVIDEQVTTEVIKPLAAQLRADNYEVKNVLVTLLSSEWFFSDTMIGAQLGSPADFIIGLMRSTTTWTAPTEPLLRHRFLQNLSGYMAALQQLLLDPPSVAGWEAYYQQPGFDHIWITSATLPLRNGLSDAMLLPNRANDRGVAILDTPQFVTEYSDPGDSLALIDDINAHFFAVPFSEDMRMRLAEEVLMNGGRYYEWATIWDAYTQDPSQVNRLIVKTYLDRLFRYVFRLAEFQLV